ncbi:unnamed protein product [Rotaria sordida]|uniref:Uncharacterized protein n=1 Tax=Rotaria sordida TaxID=392033 RepID=A0A814QPG4_9BILA|nr:unnamed protein product [Rotaria sordida]CAF3614903.1 unnamed protein product [Rotaria sordida]CAF3909052.1 unnamed protein product [Rotaria sordida]
MGNQNKIIQQNIENIHESNQSYVINLDEIVEQWILSIWNKTKTKSLSRLKHEDLLIKINWKHVTFKQNNINYYKSSISYFPRTIFRTNFDNKTTNEHSYTFTTEKSTHSIFKFIFTRSLYKSEESTIIFHLPKQIIQQNNDIQRKQAIPFGKDTTKEYEKFWNVNSQIHVPSQTRIIAELNIDEEEFHSHFFVSIHFSGRITASISTHQSPNTYLKLINGDIVQIIYQAMKNNPRLNMFKLIQGNSPSIRFKIYGKCLFRYGVKQNIVLNQELLEKSSVFYPNIPSAPLKSCY